MIPPRGFKTELYPLRHRVVYSFGLSLVSATMNSAFATLVRHTSDVAVAPKVIEVNPHNTAYNKETGPAVQKMSIIDKLRLSIRFNITNTWEESHESSSGTFTGGSIKHARFTWRPVFFSFPEKLDAADDDTGTTVATILGLTKDATFEDVVPLTTTKLPSTGPSDMVAPMSTVNIVEVFGDYNMTTNTAMEDHPWDEDLFQEAIMRYTNKGALKACVGRTRYVSLSKNKPQITFRLNKFVPRAIRRVMPYTFMGIQINVPLTSDITQNFLRGSPAIANADVGCKIICHYDEWNADHYQDMTGTG